MTIALRAIAREDGLLIYEEAGETFSLRPPWVAPQRLAAGSEGRAVGDHGFEPSSLAFEDFEALVAHARQEAHAAARAGQTAPIAESLLRLAPESALARFIDRAKVDLSAGKKDQAARLLDAMLRHGRRLQGSMRTEAASLLQRAMAPNGKEINGTKP